MSPGRHRAETCVRQAGFESAGLAASVAGGVCLMLFAGCLEAPEQAAEARSGVIGKTLPASHAAIELHGCFGYEMFVTAPKEIFPYGPPNSTWENDSPLIVPDYKFWTVNCDTIAIGTKVWTDTKLHMEWHNNLSVPDDQFTENGRYVGVFLPVRAVVEDPTLASFLEEFGFPSDLGTIHVDLGPVPWVRIETSDSMVYGQLGHFIYHDDPIHEDNVFRIVVDFENTAWWSVHQTQDDHYQVFSSFLEASGTAPVRDVPGESPLGQWFAPGYGLKNVHATFTFMGNGL